jgi:ribosome-associated toxin RatA of RatAB toxin-antitoxin module
VDHEQTTTIPVAPDTLYRTIADIGSLSRFIPPLKSVRRTDPEHVEVDAEYEGRHEHGEAWFRADDDAKRVEWGAEDQPYRGWMQVEPDGQGSKLTLHLTMTHVTPDHLSDVTQYVRRTFESIQKSF